MKLTAHPSATHVRRANRDKSMVVRCRQGHLDTYPRPDLPNPNTPDQQLSRQVWSRGCAAWRELSPEQKARWNQYAAARGHLFPGKRIEPMTGYRIFQSAAGGRQILGLALPAEAPQLPPPEALQKVELLPSAEADTLRLRVHHRLQAAGFRVVVSMSPATLRASRKPDRRNGRHVRGWGAASTAPLPQSGGEIVFTGCRYAVEPGQRFGVWVRLVRVGDGLSSAELFLDLIRQPSPPASVDFTSSPAPLAEDTERRTELAETEPSASDELELVQPQLARESEFMEMVNEFRAAGETRFDNEPGLERDDFPAYVRFLENGARGIVEGGLVPWSAYWLVRRGSPRILGVSSLRHELSPYLLRQGGHIGYAIRPSERRKGYGSAILTLTLGRARKCGIGRVLIVCHDDNRASRRIIEAHGGRLENVVALDDGKQLCRFWIEKS